jgi:hypothetical protein
MPRLREVWCRTAGTVVESREPVEPEEGLFFSATGKIVYPAQRFQVLKCNPIQIRRVKLAFHKMLQRASFAIPAGAGEQWRRRAAVAEMPYYCP